MKVTITTSGRLMATVITLIATLGFAGVFVVLMHFLLDEALTAYLPNINSTHIDLCGDIIKDCNPKNIPSIFYAYKIAFNSLLVVMFWVQHMVMADLVFKKSVIYKIPGYIFFERAMFNLASEAGLIVIFIFWQPILTPVFEFPAGFMPFLYATTVVGLFFFAKAFYDLRDIADLTGLYYVHKLWTSEEIDFEKKYEPKGVQIVENGVYVLCRHPQQLGITLILISLGRVWNLDRILITGIMIVGQILGCIKEEKQNMKLHESYRLYTKRVTNMIIPNFMNLFKKNKSE